MTNLPERMREAASVLEEANKSLEFEPDDPWKPSSLRHCAGRFEAEDQAADLRAQIAAAIRGTGNNLQAADSILARFDVTPKGAHQK